MDISNRHSESKFAHSFNFHCFINFAQSVKLLWMVSLWCVVLCRPYTFNLHLQKSYLNINKVKYREYDEWEELKITLTHGIWEEQVWEECLAQGHNMWTTQGHRVWSHNLESGVLRLSYWWQIKFRIDVLLCSIHNSYHTNESVWLLHQCSF